MTGIFYVYEHIRPDTGEVFYVGKGCGNRARNMRRDRSNEHCAIIEYLESVGLCVEIRVFAGGLTESEAFSAETARIADLRNQGYALVNLVGTEEWRKRCGSPGTSHPLWGKKHSQEDKEKLSAAAKARPRRAHTVETKAKMSLAAKARPDFQSHMQKMWAANRRHEGEN